MARFSTTQARTDNRAAVERIRQRLDGVSEANLNRSVQRTLTGAKRRFEPAAKRVIRASYNVKARDLAGKFRVRTGSDTAGEFVALEASTKGIPLIDFGGRWRGRRTAGATAEVRRGQRKTYASAFIATFNGRKRLLARQLIRGGGGRRDPRNKLRSLLGPSPFQMTEGDNDNNAQLIATEVRAFISTELERQIAQARAKR